MWLYVGANVPLVIAVLLFPRYHTFLWGSLGIGAAVAVAVGVGRNRPSHRAPWIFVSFALATFASGDIVYDVLTKLLHQSNPFPSIADVFYLATAPLIATGLVGMVRARRRRHGDSGALLDALIITSGLSVLSWIYLIEPYVHAAGLTLPVKLTSIAYPLMDILILSVLARLIFGDGAHNESIRLLSLGAIGLLAADCAYGWIQLHGSWSVGGPTDLGWVAFYVCWGAAALHPAMRDVAVAQRQRPRQLNTGTLVILSCATLTAPVLVAARELAGVSNDAGVLAVASTVVFVLVMLRLTGLARAQAGHAVRESALREFSDRLVAAKDEPDVRSEAFDAILSIGAGAVIGCVVTDGKPHRAEVKAATVPALVGSTLDVEVLDEDGDRHRVQVTGGEALPESRHWTRLLVATPGGSDEEVLLAHNGALSDDLLATLDGVAGELVMALERVHVTRLTNEASTQARFRSLIQSASDVILVALSTGSLRSETPSITTLLGYQPGAVATLRISDLLDDNDTERAETLLASMLSGSRAGPIRTQWRVRHAEGRWLDMEVIANDLSSDPNIGGIVLTLRDVSDRTRLEEELRHRAFHDGLTNLANRALLMDRVEHALRRNVAVSLLILDLDDFKLINDKLGHDGGDQMLVQIGKRLTGCLRSGDTAARLGGDEFAVCVESGGGSGSEAGLLATRILNAFRLPFTVNGAEVNARFSIGVASSVGGDHDAAGVLRNADLALYAAKDAGKNAVSFFEPGLHKAVLARLERRDELERAVALGQLRVFYQPIVRLADGELVGFEALVRWQHPVLGLLSPDEFISVAEESGIIVELGGWVLEQSCVDLGRWQRGRAYKEDQLHVSVNVSPRQLQAPQFPQDVRASLRRHGLDPAALTLEITESVLLHDADVVMARLIELHDIGVTLALDDFGTGYSSLSYLHRFPIGVIKIDRSFVQRMEEDDGLTILDAIVALAKSLNLDLIAEGIELASQARQLQVLGCAYGQGFFYGRPMPGESIERVISTWDAHCTVA
jgi:diguanylate cyclase (GGDEF)-like protein/PAS domain S-box-containing protein